MTKSSLSVTRKQLSSFLTDQMLIAQFERLFQIVASIDSTGTGEVYIDESISEAERKSIEALDKISVMSLPLDLIRLESIVSQLHSQISELKKEIESILQEPKQQQSLLSIASDFKSKSTSIIDNDVMCFDATINKWTPRTFKSSTGRLVDSSVTLTNVSGVAVGTLTNAPTAGNPTKWISVDDNGTLRKIPCW